MKTMTIEWQRLIADNGSTCNRCASTEVAVEAALEKLQKSLIVLGIKVELRKGVLNYALFANDPLLSNRISIDGRPIERWLNASTGQSDCCDACGDNQCRTITISGKVYEAIPEPMILRAGLLAAAEKLKTDH